MAASSEACSLRDLRSCRGPSPASYGDRPRYNHCQSSLQNKDQFIYFFLFDPFCANHYYDYDYDYEFLAHQAKRFIYETFS